MWSEFIEGVPCTRGVASGPAVDAEAGATLIGPNARPSLAGRPVPGRIWESGPSPYLKEPNGALRSAKAAVQARIAWWAAQRPGRRRRDPGRMTLVLDAGEPERAIRPASSAPGITSRGPCPAEVPAAVLTEASTGNVVTVTPSTCGMATPRRLDDDVEVDAEQHERPEEHGQEKR